MTCVMVSVARWLVQATKITCQFKMLHYISPPWVSVHVQIYTNFVSHMYLHTHTHTHTHTHIVSGCSPKPMFIMLEDLGLAYTSFTCLTPLQFAALAMFVR